MPTYIGQDFLEWWEWALLGLAVIVFFSVLVYFAWDCIRTKGKTWAYQTYHECLMDCWLGRTREGGGRSRDLGGQRRVYGSDEMFTRLSCCILVSVIWAIFCPAESRGRGEPVKKNTEESEAERDALFRGIRMEPVSKNSTFDKV